MVIGLGGNSTNFIQVVYVNSYIENPWLAKVVEAIEQCYLRSNVYHKNEQKKCREVCDYKVHPPLMTESSLPSY